MTTLVRWNQPARDLLGLRDIDHLLDGVLDARRWYSSGSSGFAAAVDIEENQNEFTLRMDLPGVSSKDVKVSVVKDTLTIEGERPAPGERKDAKVHRTERTHGTFRRTFTLGVPVRGDQTRAIFRDGVLEVTLPKAEEAKVREIEVQVSA